MVCWKRKYPSSASEGGVRLSKRNETKFVFITKEEEGRLLCTSNVEKRNVFRVKINLTKT